MRVTATFLDTDDLLGTVTVSFGIDCSRDPVSICCLYFISWLDPCQSMSRYEDVYF